MIIAFSGRACAGKSTIARSLHEELGLPLRSCGEAVRTRSATLGVPWKALPDDQHREVDAETVAWAKGHQPCMVEGRYLDYVLAPLGSDVTLVRVQAAHINRYARWNARMRGEFNLADFENEEALDLAFIERMYKMGKQLAPSLILDTSELSVKACAQLVVSLLDQGGSPRG